MLEAGSISTKFEGFIANWQRMARSGPSGRPIGRPGIAGDVATLPGPLLVHQSYLEDLVMTGPKI